MKFSRYLEETQTPEWKKAYIDFKGLKKRIAAVRSAEQQGNINLVGSPQETPKLGVSRSVAGELPRRSSYGSVEYAQPRNSHVLSNPTLTRVPEAEHNGGRRSRVSIPTRSLRSLNEVFRNSDQNVDKPSFPKFFANVTRRRSHRVLSQPQSTIESLYASLDPLELSFFSHLDHELEKVDKFYNEHEITAVSRQTALKDQLRELQEHRRLFYEAHSHREEPWNVFPRSLGEALRFTSAHNLEATNKALKNNRDALEAPQPPQPDGLSRDPSEYHHSKRKLKKAYQEYYRSLELLKDYRVLNLTGFRKALKKFEKVTRRPAQDLYMREKIQPCRFALSGTMDDLMREVENIFAAKFEHGDRKKARRRLKSPFIHKSHHFSTFRSGIYLGVAIPAFADGIYRSFKPATRQHIPEWGALLEIYAVLFIPVIFSFLVGLNLYAWSVNRINFPFIFELDVRTAIDNREYFELPTILFATLSYAFWLSFNAIGSHNVAPTTWPAMWIGFALIVLVNPFPILSRSSRFWLLKNVSKLLFSGKWRVEFTDFWMGDQFCSLVFSMGHLFTIVCAYTNEWENVWDKCSSSTHWPVPFVLTSLPSIVRLVQSIRRYYDSRLPTHLINGGKYLSSVVAYVVYYVWRVRGSQYNYTFVLWCFFAILNSTYTSSWDLLMDWSIFGRHTRHRFLRHELVYTNNPWVYYFAIVSNVIVRFIWTIYIPAGGLNRRVRAFIAAVLEMLRRFQWNFYRLENEQIGNTDQYRATREVPLPYTSRQGDEYDDDSDIEGDVSSSPNQHTNVYKNTGSMRMPRLVQPDGLSIEAEEVSVAKRISRHQPFE